MSMLGQLLGQPFGLGEQHGGHCMAEDEIAFVDVVTLVVPLVLEALGSTSSARAVFVVLGLVRGVLLVAVVGLSLPVRYRIGPWLFTYPEDAPRSETE